MNKQKVVIAITGASGSIYAKLLLDTLMQMPDSWEKIGVVMSDNAREVWQSELGNTTYNDYSQVHFYDKFDFSAPFASGSAQYTSMIVVPCSMGTLARIAQGTSNDLITRAADVMLKERRRLILAVRETPYNLIHIKNMEAVTLAGGIICPATPSFYSNPSTIDAVALTVVHRLLDLAGFPLLQTFRWGN